MRVLAATLPGDGSCIDAASTVADRRGRLASAVACAGVSALVLVAPFERQQPLVEFSWQSITTVEAALAAMLGTWLLASAWSRERPRWRTPLSAPWAALVGAALLAALVAPDHRGNALSMTGRFGLAFAVYLGTVAGATTATRVRRVTVAAVVSGAVAALLAVLDYLGWPAVVEALAPFRAGVAHVGAQVRASGPFLYPTIASMYLEIAFALALGLLTLAIDGRRHRLAALVFFTLLLLAEAVTLSFTRAGLVTMASSLAIVAGLRLRRHGADRVVGAIAILGVLVALQLATSRSSEAVRLRMTTEAQAEWYRASIDAPRILSLGAGERTIVGVRVTNTGRTTWDPRAAQPFRFSYHWLLDPADLVVSWEGIRTDFPAPVAPGATVLLQATVEAPPTPGEYRLLWDVEQQHRLWFSTEPDATLFTSRVSVSGPAIGAGHTLQRLPMPASAARPGRFVLWSAAARIVAARPLTGVGPDNFRLMYGGFAGLANPDTRVHANNMYLELLAGGGLVAALAVVWLVGRAAGVCVALARNAGRADAAALGPALVAACVAIALHGLVDSFLGFTATYVLMAVTLGLAVACRSADGSDAHRV